MFSAPPVIIKKQQEDDAPAPAPAADEDEEIEASWADLSSDEEEETIQINSFLDIGCAPGGDKQPPSCLPLCPPLCLTPVSKPNCTVTACMLTSLPLSFSVCLCVWPLCAAWLTPCCLSQMYCRFVSAGVGFICYNLTQSSYCEALCGGRFVPVA